KESSISDASKKRNAPRGTKRFFEASLTHVARQAAMTRCFTLSLCHFVTLSCLALASPAAAKDYRIDLDGQVDKSKFPEITFRFRIVDTAGSAVRHLPHQEIVV